MRTHAKGNLNKVIGFLLMGMMLLSLTACGGSGKNSDWKPVIKFTPPVTKSPDADDVPATRTPVGNNVDEEAAPMFKIVLGTPSGMGEPAKVIASYYEEEGESNYSFCLIPLRDDIHISIEVIYSHDLGFPELPYMTMDDFTAKLGDYYLVNSFVKEVPNPYICVRVVAREGSEQASFLVNPIEHGDNGEFTVSPGKIPDRLDENVMRLLSGMTAGIVWQHGKEIGWVDDLGLSSKRITPKQLALSQSNYQRWIDSIIGMIDYGNLEEPRYSARVAEYANVLFPGVKLDKLPETDNIPNDDNPYFPWVDNNTQILLTAPSADGKTGYVVIRISYENENGAFEDCYRVDWEAIESFDVYSPFQYRLVGVQPMERLLLGGQQHQEFSDKYLGPKSTAALKKLGLTRSPGYLDKPGAWSAGNTILLKAIGTDNNEGTETYILLDDEEDRITYLGACSNEPIDTEPTNNQDGYDWKELGIVSVPSSWTVGEYGPGDLVITGDGSFEDITFWAGFLMADSVESVVESSPSHERFTFDDGHVGYILFFDDYVYWVREDWMALNLNHNRDEAIYKDNEDLILKIARSLSLGGD